MATTRSSRMQAIRMVCRQFTDTFSAEGFDAVMLYSAPSTGAAVYKVRVRHVTFPLLPEIVINVGCHDEFKAILYGVPQKKAILDKAQKLLEDRKQEFAGVAISIHADHVTRGVIQLYKGQYVAEGKRKTSPVQRLKRPKNKVAAVVNTVVKEPLQYDPEEIVRRIWEFSHCSSTITIGRTSVIGIDAFYGELKRILG